MIKVKTRIKASLLMHRVALLLMTVPRRIMFQIKKAVQPKPRIQKSSRETCSATSLAAREKMT